jgi:hypothetical protein
MPQFYRPMDRLRSLVHDARPSSYGNWIQFHEKCYKVCGIALEFVSEVFAAHRRSEPSSPYEIKSEVCEESIIEFLTPFQKEEYTLTTALAYDVLILCEDFEIDCFAETVAQVIARDKPGAILDGIKRSFERNSTSALLETNLREHFLEFIDHDRLFELPLYCLTRNVTLPPSQTPNQINKFLDFILKSLDHFGPSASILLKSLDSNHLSYSQIQRLLERSDIHWGFVGKFSTVPIITCLNSHAELRQRIEIARIERVSIESENATLRRDQEILKHDIQQLGNDLKRFIDDTTSIIAELRSQLTELAPLSIVAELEADVNSMKATYATKSELDEVKRGWNESRQNLVTTDNLEERCRRIVQSQEEIRHLVFADKRHIPFESGARPEGIIHYLKTSDARDVQDGGLFDITSSSISSAYPGRVPKNVSDFETDNDFCSEGLPDQWICYDFKTLRVRVTHYSLRSFRNDSGKGHPKSWVLEGCDDGEHWIELDRKSNNNQLNRRLLVATVDVNTSALCPFIRLRQPGITHGGSNYLVLSGFELFGTVVSRV